MVSIPPLNIPPLPPLPSPIGSGDESGGSDSGGGSGATGGSEGSDSSGGGNSGSSGGSSESSGSAAAQNSGQLDWGLGDSGADRNRPSRSIAADDSADSQSNVVSPTTRGSEQGQTSVGSRGSGNSVFVGRHENRFGIDLSETARRLGITQSDLASNAEAVSLIESFADLDQESIDHRVVDMIKDLVLSATNSSTAGGAISRSALGSEIDLLA